ncbi:MAG: Bax inhibitor-1/YccA family protein [Proteobacteria bacterium]|nr:Bax inhibitor-1/YccA family protein [Pseudomonadota bacterium]
MKLKSTNPALSVFENTENLSLGPNDEFMIDASQRMSINGTINKTGMLIMIVIVAAAWSWSYLPSNPGMYMPFFIGAFIAGLASGFILWKKPELSSKVAPVYAVFQGLFLGGLSVMLESQYPGIAMQAALATMATVIGMLIAYRTGIIKASPMFKKVLVIAGMGIGIFYLISIGAHFIFSTSFSVNNLTNATPLGIAVSVFTTVVAALFLIMDFDRIERGANEGAPKFMEWYVAFALLVTICWLYFEMIRLIAKLRN